MVLRNGVVERIDDLIRDLEVEYNLEYCLRAAKEKNIRRVKEVYELKTMREAEDIYEKLKRK